MKHIDNPTWESSRTKDLIVNIIGGSPAPGEGFENGDDDNIEDEADQEIHRGLLKTCHIYPRNGQHQPGYPVARYFQGFQMSPKKTRLSKNHPVVKSTCT